MAEDTAAEAPATPAPKSGGIVGKLLNGLGLFALTLGAVVLGGFLNTKLYAPSSMKLGKDGIITPYVPPPPPDAHGGGEGGAHQSAVFYAIDPPLVVNFEDSSAVRFLQISMEVQGRDQKAIDSVQKNMPVIRNNLLLLMSNRDYQSLMSREGKEKLRQEALTEVRAVQKKLGGADIDDLLFTSFVVQ
jgi:flagellar basal body-associated protein FliL